MFKKMENPKDGDEKDRKKVIKAGPRFRYGSPHLHFPFYVELSMAFTNYSS